MLPAVVFATTTTAYSLMPTGVSVGEWATKEMYKKTKKGQTCKPLRKSTTTTTKKKRPTIV
jgi:hypothetical protein